MHLVLAEDNALLLGGLYPDPRGRRLQHPALRRQRAQARGLALADPEVDAAVLDVRLPPALTDEGLRAAIAVRAARPGFPVLVLSQWVEHLYARELLASGEGGMGYLLKQTASATSATSSTPTSDVSPAVAPSWTRRWSPRSWPDRWERAVDRLSPRERRCSP